MPSDALELSWERDAQKVAFQKCQHVFLPHTAAQWQMQTADTGE